MKIFEQTTAGAKQAISVKNIVFMTITTIIVTLLIAHFLKNEIVLYDVHGKITGYGDINPKLKAPKFEEKK